MEAADGILNSDRVFQELLREIPQNSETPIPRVVWIFVYGLGGNAVRFCRGFFPGDLPSYFCVFFRVLSVLGFFSESFSQRALNWASGVFGFCLGLEMPLFFVQKTAKKVLPFLGLFFRSSIFVTARFSGEGFGQRAPCFADGCFFVGSGCAFL